jgi:hypothetical protein
MGYPVGAHSLNPTRGEINAFFKTYPPKRQEVGRNKNRELSNIPQRGSGAPGGSSLEFENVAGSELLTNH